MVTNLIGGIGLFLIGMVLLTEGLKAAAGAALKDILLRFTGGPIRSVATGAAITALVQSSSATTLTTIGFVSAGLLTFPQAVGLIFGANIGTTSTGWLVAVFGLKMSVLPAALPMVGVGALARLLLRGRLASAGLALAGFGLIFVGIDTLQAGMAGLSDHLGPASFPDATLGGRLLLVAVGAAMTVVMQSSSAAVATTLAALAAGTVDLAQAGAMVIGQNVGTTVTAGVAAIGASVPAKRTAVAHVLFNVLTAVVAFVVLLPVFGRVARRVLGDGIAGNEAVVLAAFQTTFNVLGVLLLLPVVGRFSRFVGRLVPDRGSRLSRYLDRSILEVPAVAVETAHRTLRDVLAWTIPSLDPRLRTVDATRLATSHAALEEVRAFIAAVLSEPESAPTHARHVAAIHAVDHLEQLVTLAEAPARVTAAADEALGDLRAVAGEVIDIAAAAAQDGGGPAGATAGEAAERLVRSAREARERVIAEAASGRVAAPEALRRLDALRWMEAFAHHVHRALHHLGTVDGDAAPAPVAPGH